MSITMPGAYPVPTPQPTGSPAAPSLGGVSAGASQSPPLASPVEPRPQPQTPSKPPPRNSSKFGQATVERPTGAEIFDTLLPYPASAAGAAVTASRAPVDPIDPATFTMAASGDASENIIGATMLRVGCGLASDGQSQAFGTAATRAYEPATPAAPMQPGVVWASLLRGPSRVPDQD